MPTEATSGPRRLVIEVTDAADIDLTALIVREGLNKSTLINRAIHVYRMVVEAESVIIDGERVRVV